MTCSGSKKKKKKTSKETEIALMAKNIKFPNLTWNVWALTENKGLHNTNTNSRTHISGWMWHDAGFILSVTVFIKMSHACPCNNLSNYHKEKSTSWSAHFISLYKHRSPLIRFDKVCDVYRNRMSFTRLWGVLRYLDI